MERNVIRFIKKNGFPTATKKIVRYVLSLIRIKLFPTEYDNFRRDDGLNKYAFNYPELNANSIVFDVGGYKGDSVRGIYDKYKSHIYVFEPVDVFAKQIDARFDGIRIFRAITSG